MTKAKKPALKKLGFAFTEADVQLLKKLQERLSATMGEVGYIAVIRWALRQADKA